MKKRKTFLSRDGVKYTLMVEEDIIKLRQEQIDSLEKEILNMDSHVVESSRGVSLHIYRDEQEQQILAILREILEKFSIEEIVDFELIDTTFHAEHDRKSNHEICIQRDWNPTNIDYEIAECLKRSYGVEQVRIRFDPITKESWRKFSFTIYGLKNKHNETGKLAIYFEDDPIDKDKTVVVITILTTQ